MSRLESIRKRCEATIRGPWAWFGNVATDQVYLGTCHSGRIILLTPHTVKREFVYAHELCESWSLEEARKRVIYLCGAHGDEVTPAAPENCRCDEIREFLRDELDIEEGARHLYDREDRHHWLSRNMQVASELRFQGRGPDGAPDIILHSYRDLARFEVLGGKTMAEHLTDGGRRDDLYREDIVGIASPEAEFIARAREDMQTLLDALAEIEHHAGQTPIHPDSILDEINGVIARLHLGKEQT